MGKAGKPGFYAVARGRVPGVYTTWDDCQSQTAGFPGNRHQKFATLGQAQQYLAQNGVSTRAPGLTPASSSSAGPSAQHGSTLRGRLHGGKPYARVQPPPSTPTEPASSSNSKWASLTSDVIEDESGWDVVYSDGSCRGNGKVGSVAGIGVWWGQNDPRNLAERCPGGQTNNRAELIAIVRVLETTPHTRRPLLIKTDSKYSISCFRHWMPKWLKNNFRTASGEPVKNASLIRYLSALLDERALEGQKVHLQYIKGHAGHEGNEGADRLANVGATMPQEPERNWEALLDAKSAAKDALIGRQNEAKGGNAAALHPGGVGISQQELEAYAAGLGDDSELLNELFGVKA
ncbi:ribonuclease H-like domain-containing protein [Trametes elegans]|nr:ribonuclease H-like domain-containing protein [Trametes elegans]